MIKIAVVEDEDAQAETLKLFLNRYAAECGKELAVSRYADAESFLDGYEPVDMVFMDIELPDTDGLTAAGRLRELDGEALIIFVTNLAQYAVKGYEVRAFDYIVKPVGYYGFAMKLRRAFECLDSRCKRDIWVVTRQGKILISAAKLMYVEIAKHSLTFHIDGQEDVTCTGTLKAVQAKLDGLPFALCNQCYYVNLKYVTAVNDRFATVGGDRLQISIPKKKEFMCALNNFIAAGGQK